MEEERAADIAQLKQSHEELKEQLKRLTEMMVAMVGQRNTEGGNVSGAMGTPQTPEYPPGFEPGGVGANQEATGMGNVPQAQTQTQFIPVQTPFIPIQQPLPQTNTQPFVPQHTVVPPVASALGTTSDNPMVISAEEEARKTYEEKYKKLEARMNAMEGQKYYGPMGSANLALVPGLVVPHKFKVPEFDKYNGVTNPQDHLLSYVRKMSPYTEDDKMLIHFFQYSLAGSAVRWYNQLSNSKIKNWEDLAHAFNDHYKYIADLAPDRTTLEAMERRQGETFKEYARRWMEVASQASPAISERELPLMFLKTLKAPYYEKLLLAATRSFAELLTAGEALDAAIKTGMIEGEETSSSRKGQGLRREGGDVQVASREYGGHYPYAPYHPPPQYALPTPQYAYPLPRHYNPYQYSYAPSITNVTRPPRPSPRLFTPNHRPPVPAILPSPVTQPLQPVGQPTRPPSYPPREKIDPIPMSYSELLPHLLEGKLLTAVIQYKQYEPPYPDWYDVNATCAYHSGARGHTTENCITLKHKVQGLINSGRLSFDQLAIVPNHGNNPQHDTTTVDNQ